MHGPTDVKIVYELLDDVWRGGEENNLLQVDLEV
jgi:hypothetical protein